MSAKLYVVGVGPGAPEYLPPIAQKIIQQAQVLIGGQRHLKQYGQANQEQLVIKANWQPAIDYIRKNLRHLQMVVLVSGDPGLYSFLPQVRDAIGEDNIEVIPGISSVQLAFARFKQNWEDALIISLHGRQPVDLADRVKTHPKVALLTDTKFPPPQIATHLLDSGVPNRRVWVAQNLSYANEVLVDTDLVSLSQMSGFNNCVFIIGKVV